MNDRLPPNNPEAERGMLGCIILESKVVMPEIRAILPPESFYDLRNQSVYRMACELFDSGKAADEFTILCELKKAGLQTEVPMEYINALPQSSPSAYNWPTYLEELQRDMILRRLIRNGTDIAARAYDAPRDIEPLLASFEAESLAVRQYATPQAEFVDFTAMQKRLLAEYTEAMTDSGRKGLKTGFDDLDRIVGGLRAQEFIVLAGSPSSGKTSLALNIARNAAIKQQIQTGIVSLETSGYKVVHRLNCIASGASGARLLNGRPLEDDLKKLAGATSALKTIGEHLLIYDRGAVNSSQAVAMMRRQYAKGARLFILDYLQLLDAPQKTNSGNERMTLVSKAIKGAAKELDCPIIAISSLNRNAAKENRAPTRSDLRETGQLEFDADVIILLHPTNPQDNEVRTVEVNVDKNKDGETAKTELRFFPQCMQFENASKIQPQDVPKHRQHND